MIALLEHSPDLYLDEIQEQLFEMHDIDISLATITRTLKRLGYSNKKVSLCILCCIYCLLSYYSYPKLLQSAVKKLGVSFVWKSEANHLSHWLWQTRVR